MAALQLSPRTSEAIVRRIVDACASSDEHVRRVARATKALPVCEGMGATLLLTPEGEVLLWVDESVRRETDPRWITAARLEAARKFPDLDEVRPQRPVNARDCSACGATGRLTIEGHTFDCGTCFGTGWKSKWKR